MGSYDFENFRKAFQNENRRNFNLIRNTRAFVCAQIIDLRQTFRHLTINLGGSLPLLQMLESQLENLEELAIQIGNDAALCEMTLSDGIETLSKAHADYAERSAPPEKHSLNDPEVRAKVWSLTGGRCAYCDCALEQDTGSNQAFSIEHVVPRSAGGPDNIANYVPACKSCNSSKRDGHVLLFIQRRMQFGSARPELRVVGDETSGG